MGLAVDTSQTFDFVFNDDKDKPEGERPTLVFRYPSYTQFREIDALLTEAKTPKTIEEFEKGIKALKMILVGWKNQDIPYNPNHIGDVVTALEFYEIYDRLLGVATASETDKKKAKSLLRSNMVASASETKEQPAAVNVQPVSSP